VSFAVFFNQMFHKFFPDGFVNIDRCSSFSHACSLLESIVTP
jgi:hypothetical protein